MKQGKRRKVWRVPLPGGVVYAKVFDSSGSASNWLKRILGWHPAMREWKSLIHLGQLQVPCPTPIALMAFHRQDRQPPRVVLLTEGRPRTTSLMAAWDAGLLDGRFASVARIIDAVARLFAQAHQQGYSHPDAHPGNILIQRLDDAFVALFADPAEHILRIGRTSRLRSALRSLAMLDQYFRRVASGSQRLRFWRQYWMKRGRMPGRATERKWLRRLAQLEEVHGHALARRRDRRLHGDGKYFGHIRLPGGWRATVTLQLERRHVYREPAIPDRTRNDWKAICQKLISGDLVAVSACGVGWRRRPIGHSGPWASHVFEHCHRLRHRDVPAPLILGYLQQRVGFYIRDEYLLLPGDIMENTHAGAD